MTPFLQMDLGYSFDPSQTVLVYSQYKGYLEQQERLREFVRMFGCRMEYVHTSGHATRKTLAKICTLTNPTTAIIPIHKDTEADFLTLDISKDLKDKIVDGFCCKDGVEMELS